MDILSLVGFLIILDSIVFGWVVVPFVKNRSNYSKLLENYSVLIKPENRRDLYARIASTLIASIVTGIFVLNVTSFSGGSILTLLFGYLVIIVLYFFAVYDTQYFEIPDKTTIATFIALLLLNIIVMGFIGTNSKVTLWPGMVFYPLYNFIASFVYAGLIALIVFITQGKGMGGGDIRIAAILGIIGGDKIIPSIYITIFSGLLVGIFVILKTRKYRGTAVPFVPFMIFGLFVSILFATEIQTIIEKYILWSL